ncbi:MAG: hypothetical protein WKF33_05785 [Thermoleophilaceae bacterium]
MVSLALTDIQGNILQGYGFPLAAYLFLEVPDESSGRSFLGEIVGGVTNADQWDDPPAWTTNVALTCAGLRALGVADTVLRTLPRASSNRSVIAPRGSSTTPGRARPRSG